MISKNNITRCANTLNQLISRCESYGEFDEDGKLNKASLRRYLNRDFNGLITLPSGFVRLISVHFPLNLKQGV
jgi:hypothetical protein